MVPARGVGYAFAAFAGYIGPGIAGLIAAELISIGRIVRGDRRARGRRSHFGLTWCLCFVLLSETNRLIRQDEVLGDTAIWPQARPGPRARELSLPLSRGTDRTAPMTWAWVVLIVVAIGIPAAVVLRSRTLKPPREPFGSPIPKLDRVDRWLYDQYQLGNLDRSRISQAVIEGRELSEPALRHAAQGLAAAMLTGQVGILSRSKERILLGAALGLMIAIVAVAVATGRYAMLVPGVAGLALLPLSARMWKRDRQRVERAHQLNS